MRFRVSGVYEHSLKFLRILGKSQSDFEEVQGPLRGFERLQGGLKTFQGVSRCFSKTKGDSEDIIRV